MQHIYALTGNLFGNYVLGQAKLKNVSSPPA